MARKSRKDLIRAENSGQTAVAVQSKPCPEPAPTYLAVGYARLSIFETRDRADSEALQNQKELLRQYIANAPDLQLVGIFEDNGQTGTNFDRAGFETMMETVRSGKANCIVVKDLSRFGRDYVEAGNYLEHIFPFMGVRFISISDGYDNADATTADCLTVALKNMVNQMYSKDISRKSGSVLREKIRRGEFIGAFASYGYRKDPADGHRIVVDPEAAGVVREIFRRKLEGQGDTAITRWLNAAGVPSPGCYRYQKGIILDKRFARYKPWLVQSVKDILRNEVYLGRMVQGRRRSEFYAGRPDKRLPRDEWTVVENTHEPIISREDFDAVQAICVERNAAYRARLGKYDHLGKRENILKGLVYCSDCGRTMVRYKQVSHGKNVSYYYLCPSYAAMLEQSGCSYKFLPEDFLLDSLEQVIQKEIEQAVDMTALAKRLSARVSGKTDQGAMMLKKLNAQLERVEETRRNAMRDYLGGQMEQTDYELLKECCLGEAEELKKQIFDLREQQQYQAETLTEKNPWLAAFGGLGRPFHLTKELAASLIERVTIYGNNRVEILLRFRDEREQLLAAAGEEEAV